MTVDEFRDLCSRADLLILRAVPLSLWRPEYMWPRRRVFIDVDPGYTQACLAEGDPAMLETVERCEHLFTIAQRIGASDCRVPSAGRDWTRTLAPVWLGGWPMAPTDAGAPFTTVMQWRSYGEGHRYAALDADDPNYAQKDVAFGDFLDLPRHTGQSLRLALTGGSARQLRAHGWKVVSGWRATRTTTRYRRFIRASRAELCVPKRGYVASRAGWFSDRSACYLASGKPVLMQDTGLADWLPPGEGVLTFGNLAEAVRGIETINRDYAQHSRAARLLAEARFSTERVLPRFLEAAMIGPR
jgi:hypothetical protein